jgi:riboflavin kinase/FMN adenylyltransferase
MSEFAREELEHFRPQRDTALTVGNFDGVHLGHRHLVEYVTRRARENDLAAGVVTLYPDPDTVLRPRDSMRYITSFEQRIELLRRLGLDLVVPLSFTSELAELTAEAFVGLLKEQLRLKLLIMGPGHAFGRNREGTPERISEIGRGLGFEVEVIPEGLVQRASLVSATAIRKALADGDLEAVERQLGRRYALRGPVIRGDQRGRTLGFPTANVGVTADRALPAFGVYATWAYLGEARYPSVTNVGMRPTFDGERVTVETYIFDFDQDIYDRLLRLEFVKRLRPEFKFENLEAIKTQIGHDAAQAQAVLAADS